MKSASSVTKSQASTCRPAQRESGWTPQCPGTRAPSCLAVLDGDPSPEARLGQPGEYGWVIVEALADDAVQEGLRISLTAVSLQVFQVVPGPKRTVAGPH